MTKIFYLTQGKENVSATSSSSSPGIWSYFTSRFTATQVPEPGRDFKLALHTHTPVEKVSPLSNDSKYRWVVETPRGNIKARYVIHATNAYASHLLPHLASPQTGIVPTRGQVVALRASVPAKQLWSHTLPGWGGNQGYEYWFARPTSSEEEKPLVILGGGRESSGPAFEYNLTDDSIVNPVVSKTLKDFLHALYGTPQFEKGVEPEMEWVS
jgi:glycine/D-amino acid oxidase-like deaminating enzyme